MMVRMAKGLNTGFGGAKTLEEDPIQLHSEGVVGGLAAGDGALETVLGEVAPDAFALLLGEGEGEEAKEPAMGVGVEVAGENGGECGAWRKGEQRIELGEAFLQADAGIEMGVDEGDGS